MLPNTNLHNACYMYSVYAVYSTSYTHTYIDIPSTVASHTYQQPLPLLDCCASSCQTSSSPYPGMYICGVLDNGCIIYRDITSKEGFQVSDSPMSTTELRKSSSKCTYVVCLYGNVN